MGRGTPEWLVWGRHVWRCTRGSAALRRTTILVVLAAIVGAMQGIALVSSAVASHTPAPSSVTIAGSLQSESGCTGDWDPACAQTHLPYDASDDVWQGTFALPAGSYD